MNYLFFTPHYPSFCWSVLFGIILDQVEVIAQDEANQVTLVYCDSCKIMGKCFHKHTNPGLVCSLCNIHQKYLFKKLAPNIQVIALSKLAKGRNTEAVPSFNYNSVKEIKQLNYKNVDIGYAAFSTYLSHGARNLNPLIDDSFKNFFNQFLERCSIYANILDSVLEEKSPDHVYLFNSRLIDSKPIVDLCKDKKIPFTSLEYRVNLENQPRKTSFENTTPHDIDNLTLLINKQWDTSTLPLEEKIQVAATFYSNRRNAIAAGDKVYVKDQQVGLLPEQWDEHKHNIVIFNSSEDEFASVGKLYESKLLFPTQLDGLKTVFESFKDRPEIHFYLRIHPNLKNVKYLFHKILYEFDKQYPNLTVIPASSPISTYSLIDAANKVIVFGSTTGVESVYWGKPTILLSNSGYMYLDTCHVPNNIEEAKDLISNFNLPAKDKLGALKLAYYLLNSDSGNFNFFKVTSRVYHIFGRPVRIQSFKIKGSKFSKYRTSLSQFMCKLVYDFIPNVIIPDKEDERVYEKYRTESV